MVKIVFFYIFRSYYKDGNFKNDIPWLTAINILSASLTTYTFCIFLIIENFYNELKFIKANSLPFLIMYVLIFIFLYLYLLKKEKHLIFYEEYKKQKTFSGLILSWGFVILPFPLMMFIVFYLSQ